MRETLVLAVDQGTTNTKALLFAADGSVRGRASRPVAIAHPQPGWAEQSATEIWVSVRAVIGELIEQSDGSEIAALAITNQRETIVLWDAASGEPVAPAVTWQCRRSSERCAELRAAGHQAMVAERTGLAIDPLFPAAKLAWLLDHLPDGRARAARGELRAGTIDSWLVWKLTGRHATDMGNAARTQLFNLHTLAWDRDLAALFDVPLSILPEVLPSDGYFGETTAGLEPIPPGLPIRAVLGDLHAALRGHGTAEPGRAKVTCGTGSSVMIATNRPIRSEHGLSTTIAWAEGAEVRYALEGNITVFGKAASIAAAMLNLPDERALSTLAQTAGDSGGICFVPAFAGLGAPHWQDRARGLITGMSLGTTAAHVARAALEGMALQIVDVVRAVEADLGGPLASISVDGGAAENDFLMQILADLLDRPVVRPDILEASALGAASIAATAIGSPLGEGERAAVTFRPAIDAAARAAILDDWRRAIARAALEC